MMIFGVYPIAMAIRATNVYEERALGIDDADERAPGTGLSHLRAERSYIGEHLQQQLACVRARRAWTAPTRR
jgi:Trk-type K+ transport system membrane component